MDKAKQASIIKKVALAWKKWNDSAVKKEEKEAIKATIDKLLTKYNLNLDWKTGKVTSVTDNKKQSTDNKKQSTDSKKKAAKQGMSTNDLIKFIFETYGDEWTGKNLRRKIRQMDKWNDGKMTHYDFSKSDVIEILNHIGYDTKEAAKKLA